MKLAIRVIGLPVIDRVGLYPLWNPVFEFVYRNPTHAVHLFNYSCKINVDGKVFPIHPGDLTFIHGGSVYSLETDRPGEHWCVHFYDDAGSGSPIVEFPTVLRPGNHELFLRDQIKQISSLHNARGKENVVELLQTEARYRLKAFLLSAYSQISSHNPQEARSKKFEMSILLTWIDANLKKCLPVEMIAKKAGVSRATLAKRFQDKLGTTLSQYLLHRRIDQAKQLLTTSQLTIQEVGAAVGIPDPQYFNKQFRRVNGESPNSYRENHKAFISKMPANAPAQDGNWVEE